MKRVLVIHGPNLNLLGSRERHIYGSIPLKDIDRLLNQKAKELNIYLVTFQSNSEEEIITAIHRAKGKFDFIVINPGALTHTSIALRDALLGTSIPFVEVHISNVFSREEFRKRSVLSDIARGVISGFGIHSYTLALTYIAEVKDGKTL